MTTTEAYQFAQSNPEAAQQAQETMRGVLVRSSTDLAFRERLLADPRTALAEHTGREIPAGTSIAFIENRADATIVLPAYVDGGAELSEEELEAVAGGTDVVFWVGAAVVITVFATGVEIGRKLAD